MLSWQTESGALRQIARTLETNLWWRDCSCNGREVPRDVQAHGTIGHGQEFEKIMEGYHDLIDHGRREIYKIES